MVNQEIAEYLIKLKNADKTNKYGCYGFLPENNEQYWVSMMIVQL